MAEPRVLLEREDFLAALERVPVVRAEPLLRLVAPDVPLLADADLVARLVVDFFAAPPEDDFLADVLALLFVAEPAPVARDPPLLDFDAVERALLDLPRLDLPADPREPLDDPLASSLHLPLITRCAASATASAIKDPSRLALDMAVLAALDAASAASRPASRILRRAAGLALIAAAAAARPAASISRLIAALVILSTVVSFDPEEEPEEDLVFLVDFAIAGLPLR